MAVDRHDHGDLLLPQQKRKMPIFSWVGIISLAISLVLFGILGERNSDTIQRVEALQKEQTALAVARAPLTRLSLCNGLRVAIAVIQPTSKDQEDAIAVLKQNIEVLNCPDAIVELPTTTRAP